ncbi:MAG: DUF6517 family protein, partial [Haloferacaceae archaeon]
MDSGYLTGGFSAGRLAIALALLVVLSGCVGGSYAFAAEPASIDEGTLSEAGYEHAEPEEVEVDEQFQVGGEDVDVEIRSWVASYERTEVGGELVVVSTPDATVAGQSVNPLVRLSGGELVTRALEAAGEGEGNLRDVEEVGVENRTILDRETPVRSYEGVLETDAGEVPIAFHLATVEHGDDVIVLL